MTPVLTMRAGYALFTSCFFVLASGEQFNPAESLFFCRDITTAASSGAIFSPNYPLDYDNNLNCTIQIDLHSQPGLRVEVLSFDTELGFDYLTFLGTNIGNQTFSGLSNDTFLEFYSSGPYIELQFTSDESTGGTGFHLLFSVINLFDITYFCANNPKDLLGSSGVIYSPNYPEYYPNNVECTISILPNHQVPSGFMLGGLKVQFLAFDTEPVNDYLSMAMDGYLSPHYSGNNNTGGPTIGETFSIYGETSSISWTFKTNENIKSSGFHLQYDVFSMNSRVDFCFDYTYFTAPTGVIASPNYGEDSYPTNIDCSVFIRVHLGATTSGDTLRILVDDFHTEATWDVLTVYTSTGLRHFSGSGYDQWENDTSLKQYHKYNFHVLDEFIQLRFHSDYNDTREGFYLRYSLDPEYDFNECLSNRCENGGTCTDVVDGFICDCGEYFTGTRCESAIPPVMSGIAAWVYGVAIGVPVAVAVVAVAIGCLIRRRRRRRDHVTRMTAASPIPIDGHRSKILTPLELKAAALKDEELHPYDIAGSDGSGVYDEIPDDGIKKKEHKDLANVYLWLKDSKEDSAQIGLEDEYLKPLPSATQDRPNSYTAIQTGNTVQNGIEDDYLNPWPNTQRSKKTADATICANIDHENEYLNPSPKPHQDEKTADVAIYDEGMEAIEHDGKTQGTPLNTHQDKKTADVAICDEGLERDKNEDKSLGIPLKTNQDKKTADVAICDKGP